MNRIIILIVLSIWIYACGQGKGFKHNIHLESQIKKDLSCKLSDIAVSVSFTVLETNPDCLLPNNSHIIALTYHDIFIWGQKYIYRFNRNGNFENIIGSVGKGPHEYNNIWATDIDTVNKYVLILDYIGNVFIYNFEGQFVDKIHPTKNEIRQIKVYGNNSFICETRNYKEGLYSYISVFSYTGKLIHKELLESDKLQFKIDMLISSIMYHSDQVIKFKTPYNDTIYQYNNDHISVSRVIGLGKLAPGRDIIENMNNKHILYLKYVNIVDIIESDDYLFMLVVYKAKLHSIVVRKADNSLVCNMLSGNPKNGGGIEDDITRSVPFWPNVCYKGNRVARLVHVPEQNEDANEVMQVVYLK